MNIVENIIYANPYTFKEMLFLINNPKIEKIMNKKPTNTKEEGIYIYFSSIYYSALPSKNSKTLLFINFAK